MYHQWKKVSSLSAIDTDARWVGFNHTRGGIFGYKLHMAYSADLSSIIVPLAANITTANITTANITTANIPDNQVYLDLMSSLSSSTTTTTKTTKTTKVYLPKS